MGIKRYAHIDALRALAVMLVVVAHAQMENGSHPRGGATGVTVFFSISGFIITNLLLKERDATRSFDIRGFYVRRFLKIVPPLVVCILIPTLIYSFFHSINWSAFFGIAFFYYNWMLVKGVDAPLPGSNITWSLSIEEQFYVVFALIWLWFIKRQGKLSWLAGFTFLAAGYSLAARIHYAQINGSQESFRIYAGSDTRLDGIALGVLTSLLFYAACHGQGLCRSIVNATQSNSALFAATALFGLSVVIRNEWFRQTLVFSVQSLATCIIILYGFGVGATRQAVGIRRLFNRVCHSGWVLQLGLASYSIYLSHLIVMKFVVGRLDFAPVSAKMIVLIVAGTGAGLLVYRLVEVPIHRWRRGNLKAP